MEEVWQRQESKTDDPSLKICPLMKNATKTFSVITAELKSCMCVCVFGLMIDPQDTHTHGGRLSYSGGFELELNTKSIFLSQ